MNCNFQNVIIVYNILKYLDIEEIFNCELVCSVWYSVIGKSKLWEILFLKKLFNVTEFENEENEIYNKYGRLKEINIHELNIKSLYNTCFPHHYNKFKNLNCLKKKIGNCNLSNFKFELNNSQDKEIVEELFNNEFKPVCTIVESIINSIEYNKSNEYNNNQGRLFITSKLITQSSFPKRLEEINTSYNIEYLIIVPNSNYEYTRIVKIKFSYSINTIPSLSIGHIGHYDFKYKFEYIDLDNHLNNQQEFKFQEFEFTPLNQQDIEMIPLDQLGFNIANTYFTIPKSTIDKINLFLGNDNNNYLEPLNDTTVIEQKSPELVSFYSVYWKLTFLNNILKNKPVEFQFYSIDDTTPIHYNEYTNGPSEWYENDKNNLWEIIKCSIIHQYYHNYSFIGNIKVIVYKLIISITLPNNSILKLFIKYKSIKSLFSIKYSIDNNNNSNDIKTLYENIKGIETFDKTIITQPYSYSKLSLMNLVSTLFTGVFPCLKFKLLSLLIITNLDQFMSFQFIANNKRLIQPLQRNEDLENMYGFDLDYNKNI